MTVPALVPLTKAATELGICERTARKLAQEDGQLVPGVPVFHVRGRWYANRAQLDRFCAGDVRAAS